MKLIKVETKGFKSFADKTTLTFDGGVVGIVGPNGSGKSNINDAIKWVLGEGSAKSLRGSSMEDVIFSGSKTVQAMDAAQVSLTFDNSQGLVSIPHKRFTISRVLKRGSGSNQYYINGEIARLKDIKEIAMESGMSKSSLAIISQGTIQNIAQATPVERRGIFEEAAGISKYKSRKIDALRKLDRTSEALDKIKTVVNELERQLAPLKRQADKARVYLQKYDSLKDVEIGLIVEDVSFFETKLAELNEELENVIASKEDLNERISKSESEIETKNSHKLKLENDVITLTSKFQDLADKLRDLDVRESQVAMKRKMIIEGQIKATDSTRLEVMKDELEELRSKINQYNIWEEKSLSDISEKKTSVSTIQEKLAQLSFENERNKNNLLKIRTKVSILKDHRDNKTNLFKGTKTVVENATLFPGFQGIVADLLSVNDEHKSAIESVLQNALQHVVVDKSESAVRAVNFLKANNGGRATFIPLSSIQPKGIRQEHYMILESQTGFVGMGSDLVSVDPRFEILKKFLLGNIVFADTIDNANNISKLLQKRYMVVSLEGDIVRVGGIISGGTKTRTRDMLGTDSQINKYEQAIPALESTIIAKTAEENRLRLTTNEDHSLVAELNIEVAKVREKRSIIESQFATLKVQYETEAKEELVFSEEVKSIDSIDFLEAEKSSVQALLKAKRESIINLNNDLSRLTISKTELEKSLRAIIESSSTKMTEKNQADFIVNSSKTRLTEEYEMTMESAKENFTLTMNREKAREFVSKLRHEIKELGHVNVDSIEAFDEVNDRFEHLSSSRDELFSAQQTILAAINEMDQIIISRLDETVKAVNSEMDAIFKTMFGGGTAEVKYTDPSDLLETGIEVRAQPPGKTVKNLNLFSGGEKALVAISLLFAILKSRPLPLCILDEVEAALDDTNVIRFAEYLQKLKHKTQFIVVTHRVGTMSRVDHLFGATMQQRGVTSFFSVELSKAKKMIDN